MALPINDILALQGNKYATAAAAMRYAQYLFQENSDDLTMLYSKQAEKTTLVALREVLQGKLQYTVDNE